MTTYTIHENAGETSKIELDGDSGKQENNYVYLVLTSAPLAGYYSGGFCKCSNYCS